VKRLVLITEHQPDLQTQRSVEHVRAGLAGDYELVVEEVAANGLTRTLGCVMRARNVCRNAHAVHAFGYRALKVASFAASGRLLYTPLPEDGPKAVRWARSAIGHRDLRAVCVSSGEHRTLIESGFPAERCDLIRPGVRLARSVQKDLELRAKLGIREGEVAILAVGESRAYANHLLAIHAASVLYSMRPSYRCIFWGRGPEMHKVQKLHDAWQSDCLINAEAVLKSEVDFEQLIPAADLGVITGPERISPAAILACMAGGLPLVAPANYAVSEILEDHHTALLYVQPKTKLVAQRLLALAEDTPLQRKLADQARAEAYELFSVSQFVDALRRIYA
jgi:glycosyltransferase involved in cell wall biosynthesis